MSSLDSFLRRQEDAQDQQALEQRRIDCAECYKCGSENTVVRRHNGSFLAPECTWTECEDCGATLQQPS
jgi:hypothetical protein